ncbi:MAG TPA: hypothetical protein VG410_14385 [Solirubrobacteraceae bacterium]|nr:hypothetical protein [Solirubrobacteraceae bacterium]
MRASGGKVLLVLLWAAVVCLPTAAAARSKRHHGQPTPAKAIATAQRGLRGLSSSFARGQRSRVLGELSQSAKALGRHQVCKAIVPLDAANGLLLAKRTWRHGTPKSVRRTIAPLLNSTERSLAKGARSCAAVSHGISRPRSTRVGGGSAPPVPSYTSINSQGGDEGTALPAGPFRPLTHIGAPVTLTPSPQFIATASDQGPGAHAADAGQFAIGRSTNLGVAAGGGEPKEMTTATGHNVVWYTGNLADSYSLDGGQTWSAFASPSTILSPDPPNVASCCDQQVVYAPAQNLFVWLVQYWCPASVPPGGKSNSNDCTKVPGNNVIRFAVATPEEIRQAAAAGNVGKAWHVVMDMTPQQLGEPSNTWFDYSTLSVNDRFANWTADMFLGNAVAKDASVAMRINLQSLATSRFQANYFFSSFHTLAAQQPPGETRSLFVADPDTSTTRVWDWRENSAVAIGHDISHPTTPIYDYSVPGTDGIDWNARAGGGLSGHAITAAWSHNELIVATINGRSECTAKCNTKTPTLKNVFAHPGATLLKVNTTDWTVDQLFGELWSTSMAISWPTLGVATDGEIGLTFLASAENANPVAWAGYLNMHGDQLVSQVSDPAAGPQPGLQIPGSTNFSGGTGDYYSLQPGAQQDSFVMPFRSVDPTAGGPSDDWHFLSYAHEPVYNPTPPGVENTSPTAGATFTQGTRIGFKAVVSDALDVQIPDDAIYWSVDGKVTPYHGSQVFISDLDYGDHSVTVTAVNSSGLSASSSVMITIVPPTPGAPTVAIDSPLDGTRIQATNGDAQGDYVDIPFQAHASDPQGKALVYSWDDTVQEGSTSYSYYGISHQLSPTLRLYVHETNCGAATHTLVLNVSNGTQAATATVHVTVSAQVCVK